MSNPTRDWSTRAGAEVLAEKIRGYWAARGRKIDVVVLEQSPKYFIVRSNIAVLAPVGSPT